MNRKDARTPHSPARRLKLTLGMLAGGLCVVAVCLAGRYYMFNEAASADSPRGSFLRPTAARTAAETAGQTTPRATQSGPQAAPAAPSNGGASQLKIVASVNGEDITRNDLANECLKHYGEEVLASLVNKHLILQECQRRNISVTQAEVNAEIKQMAERFSLPVEHWLKMLEQERGVSPRQYANDIIWPMLALRKLAGPKLQVTREELARHFESQYGERVRARMIVCDDRNTAEEIRAAAVADPEQFGALAKRSVDAPSASLNGLIQPIRKHVGPPEIEQAAFQMRDGEISPVIPVSGQYVILKREGLQPAVKVAFEQVKMGMIEAIRDAKMRSVAAEIFRQLQDQAKVVNVLNDPEKRRQMPGVAAVINGRKITIRELAEVCIERHGEEVLEGTINRRLLEQALKRQNISVTDEDLDREIARAAAERLPLKPDGSPDVEKWLHMVTEEQEISLQLYRSDTVWPTVALKKLVGGRVEVTDEDLRKGYEASFGPRVRCLAIVMDDLRRAQKVWGMARANPTKEYFGDLAAQYSADPAGKALRGEVPPIQKYGGHPELEKEAFSLQPGELSGIVQVGTNTYAILFCEGRTKPVHVDFAAVRDELYADIHEKKLRIAMADKFQQLQDAATIDNYLAGTVQSPPKRLSEKSPSPSGRGSG